jgi:hypothetical protein
MEEIFGKLSPLLLIAMIAGLVEFAKRFKIEGNASLALSLGLGVLFGTGYQLSLATPTTFAGWFTLAVFDILFGLVTSGLYDLGKSFAKSPVEDPLPANRASTRFLTSDK